MILLIVTFILFFADLSDRIQAVDMFLRDRTELVIGFDMNSFRIIFLHPVIQQFAANQVFPTIGFPQ